MSQTNSTAMTLKERFIHAILFEIGAIVLVMSLILLFSDTEVGLAFGAGFAISFMATVWNFVFNYGFDKVFTAPRETRGVRVRVFHTLAFETGLLIFTIPVMAYLLKLTLWQAFLADLGITLSVMVYALIFNWIYDNIRLKFVGKIA